MSPPFEKTRQAFAEAQEVMPLGVASNFRYWGDTETPVIDRGEGAYIWDMDGNRYIDYRLAFGPIILGHAHPVVNQRVSDQLARGTLFAHTHMLEVRVAQRIIRMCPGVEKVRLVNSGTEATMHALRIARGYTGRERILKFEGHFHGFQDYLLWSTASVPPSAMGSPRNPTPVAMSAGIPRGLIEYLTLIRFNDYEGLERTVRAQWGDLAAIIVEPIMGNAGSTMAEPGFLELIRQLCDKFGIVMIVDEVKTGFRVAPGGAGEHFGIHGDIMTYAKSMANGFPIAAIGGRAEVMEVLGAGVGQGGSYCGNAVSTAAADATLEVLETSGAFQTINQRGQRLMSGVGDVLTEAGIDHVIMGPPSMFGLLLGRTEPSRDLRDVVMHSDISMYTRIAKKMREFGVEYEADPREPWFLCAAHSEKDVDETLNKFNDAIKLSL